MWRLLTISSDIDSRISGTYFEKIFHEFISNSFHYPLAIIITELWVIERPWQDKAILILCTIIAAVLQAIFLGSASYDGRKSYLLGNLISPAILFLFITLLYGAEFFEASFLYQVYGLFALLIGVLQELNHRTRIEFFVHIFILVESFFHAVIPLVVYLVFDQDNVFTSQAWNSILEDPSHIYLFSIFPLFGVKIGLGNINNYRYQKILRVTAVELRTYSEWLLGPNLFKKLSQDPEMLKLKRKERTVVFVDIRGFTNWSEKNGPEEVAALISQFYSDSEKVFSKYNALKWEFTGDEVLSIFDIHSQALQAAMELRDTLNSKLKDRHLMIGMGINTGPVIEGIVGGEKIRKFSVLGDTVNTGKRICDLAGGGEILISEKLFEQLKRDIVVDEPLLARVKGKSEKLKLYPLVSIKPHPKRNPLKPIMEKTSTRIKKQEMVVEEA